MRRCFAALPALLLFAFPSVAQLDEQVHFSIASNRTFGPKETPIVQVWGEGVEKLQFRVYKVKDPVAFFEKLEDDHRFGGQAPRQAKELTAIERFHAWKQSSRTALRNLVRRQFSQNSRTALRSSFAAKEPAPAGSGPAAAPKAAEYADIPILNEQQVVAVWEQPLNKRNRWDAVTVPVRVKGNGLYLVEATDGRLQAYTVVSVSNFAIMTKTEPGRLHVRVVRREDGAPVAGIPVQLYLEKKAFGTLTTDERGIVSKEVRQGRVERVLALARRGEDFAATSIYGWNLSENEERQWISYIYTDRPVYRPGHQVFFKGVFRKKTPLGYRLPERRDLNIEVQDPEGNTIVRKTAALSPNGAINGDFTLPVSAPLGYYSIEVRAGEGSFNGAFHVEEYKKPEYEVRVLPEKNRVLQGDAMRATIEARYYYGEPVKNAKLKYVVFRSRYWDPYFGDESEGDTEQEADPDQDRFADNEQVMEEEGQLDENGRLTVSVPSQQAKFNVRYRIEARVTDEGSREIAGAGFVLATQGSFQIHAVPEKYVYAPSERARFLVETRDYDGKAVPNVPFKVRLSVWRWKQDNEDIGTVEGRTDVNGKGAIDAPVRSGSLIATVSTRTPEGREIESTTWLWVTGDSGWSTNRSRIQIVPDKKSYKAGEIAKVLIITGVPSAHLWVTTEGRALQESVFVQANSPTVTVNVPVKGEYAPNFFVTASFLRDSQLYIGTKSLKVPPTDKTLNITVKASKDQFQPGEAGTYLVEARDAQNRPVQGEFSIGVVDEAIYAIRRETNPDILRAFYGPEYNAVTTDSSLGYYFHGEAGKRRMQLTRLRPPNWRAQLKPERFIEPNVRKAFPDTMYWLADLRTGADGRASVQVKYPDALTTWRATVRGITVDSRVGQSVNKTIVKKNLVLSLAVPRFFAEGDEVTVSANVRNYLPNDQTVRVTFEAQGLDLLSGNPTQDVPVASKGQAKIEFRVKAKPGEEVKLLAKALAQDESDALELTLPVRPYGVKLSEAKSGAISEASGRMATEFTFPPDIASSSRRIEIAPSPSVAGAVFGALDYLLTFPYGCTEQTMSSFLPNVVVSKAAKDLNLKLRSDPQQVALKVRAGLDRLYDFQHEDGGWGWWKTDESDPFMTAYVLFGLTRAREAAYSIPQHRTEQAANWLKSKLPELRKNAPDLEAYAVYALSEAGVREAPAIDALFEKRSSLTPYSLALLGLTLRKGADNRSAQVAQLLESKAKISNSEVYWQSAKDTMMDIVIDNSPEATAWAVKFLVAENAAPALLPKAALYLVNHRNEGYYWTSTKQTAMVIFGLTDYLAKSGELRPNFAVSVFVNDRQVLTKRYTEADALNPQPQPLVLKAADLDASRNRIRIEKQGEGRLYWSVREEYFSTATQVTRTGSAQLNLQREYFKLTPVKEGGKIVYRPEPAGPVWQRGDVIAVKLTLSGSDWRYLLIEDPIPAGVEHIERDDLYELKEKPAWWETLYSRREARDDRTALFQTYFTGGARQFVYLLKVNTPGKFRVSPARVQPMYQPQYLATTEGRDQEVQ